MSLYNQSFIDASGESLIRNNIEQYGAPRMNGDIFTLEKNKNLIALDHYLAKRIISGQYSKTIEDCIKQRYEDFKSKPWLFVNSPLLKNDIISKTRNLNQSEIKAVRDNYYSDTRAKELYKKSLSKNLNDKEKNQLYAYFIHHINTDNKKLQEVMDYKSKTIIDSNVKPSEMNTMELQFYAQNLIAREQRYYTEKSLPTETRPIVSIGFDKPTKEVYINGFQNNCIICINKEPFNDNIVELTQTVFHEYRHSIQEKDAKKTDRDTSFEMAYFELFYKYLNKEKYDCYHENYKYMGIEIDAEKMGFYKAQLFFENMGRNDLSKYLQSIQTDSLDYRGYYPFMKRDDGKKTQLDTYVVENMDKVIREHPDELNNYPVLKTIYNDNGSRKDFLEILNERAEAHVEYKNKFHHYINYDINNNILDNIDLKRDFGKEKTAKMIPMLSSIFLEKEINIYNYIDDNIAYRKYSKYFKDDDLINTTAYQINLANQMVKFVNKNFNLLATATDEELSQTHPLYRFIQTIDEKSINNPKLNKSELVNYHFNDFKNNQEKLLNNFNNLYIKQKVQAMPEEDKNRIIEIEDQKYTVEDYLMNYAVSSMDKKQNIHINNQVLTYHDIIDASKRDVSSKELNRMIEETEVLDNSKNNIHEKGGI